MKGNVSIAVLSAGLALAALACTGSVGGAASGTGGAGAVCGAGQMKCGASCSNVATDTQNCGACGHACAIGQTCGGGQCVCSDGLLACGGQCVASNAAHCGSCDNVCGADQACSNGACGSCPANEVQCTDGACVSPTSGTAVHCGGCTPCAPGATCNAGVCTCGTGQMMCGTTCVDVTTSLQHCGGCNQPCSGSCVNGACMGGMGGSGGGGSTGTACTPLPATQRRLWRLSAEQWGSAVKDLLGLASAPTLTNLGGEAQFAFFADTTLGVDPQFQYALYDATQQTVIPTIASKIGGASGAIAPCSGTSSSAQTTCAQTFIQTFAKKAYRRPVDSSEVTNLMKLYTQGAMQDYATGVSLMIQSVLISTSFVYRTELGPSTLTADASGKFPDTTLTPYEVASQLGFMLGGSIPDDQTIAAADNGSLATASGVGTQIDRLLATTAVKANLTNVMIDWFNARQMFTKTKDTSLFSALATTDQDQPTLEGDLLASTQQFVNEVLWTNSSGTVDDLLGSQRFWVNKRLATLFPGLGYPSGAPTSNTTFVKATWPASQGRAGMLTQPAVLWAASDPALTSIVKRGKFIHDDILCQDSVGMLIDLTTPQAMNVINCKAPDGTTSLSTCDSEVLKSDARLKYQPCTVCHSQMDPYSRVLLNFGPIGNYRTTDEAGRAIDPTVTFVPNSPFAPQMLTGAQAFSQTLAASGVLRGCAVQKVASYALGDMIRTYNTCELNDLRSQTNGTITSLFKTVALANFLRARTGGTK
jgi:hypothetical protein